MMKFLWVMLLLFICNGCAQNRGQDSVYRGTYIYGVDVDIVRLCDAEETFWVWSQAEIEPVLNDLVAVQSEQAFYIEFTGEFLRVQQDTLPDRYASSRAGRYAGLVRIDGIVKVMNPVPESCQ
jgi:hypothetical protein